MAHDDPFAGKTVHADWAYYLDTAGTYTPTLTASITNPTLGTGAVQSGWWHRSGHFISGGGIIRFGTSGVNAGSGTYFVLLPFDADVSTLTASAGGGLGIATAVGPASLRDNSNTTGSRTATLLLTTASTCSLHISDNSLAGNATPWIWATEDGLSYQFGYLADPAGLPT